MTTPAGPAYLTPTWRYAGDDWSGSNALIYTVYQSDAQGNPTTTPMDLTGFTVSGTVAYRSRSIGLASGHYRECPPDKHLLGVSGAIILATAGTIALSVPKADTIVLSQGTADWYRDIASGQVVPSGWSARLVARPAVTDPSSNTVTVGLQPLYVF